MCFLDKGFNVLQPEGNFFFNKTMLRDSGSLEIILIQKWMLCLRRATLKCTLCFKQTLQALAKHFTYNNLCVFVKLVAKSTIGTWSDLASFCGGELFSHY